MNAAPDYIAELALIEMSRLQREAEERARRAAQAPEGEGHD
jgi:hypothetical protein